MIAWNRICRPGSIIGPQQHFLTYCESMLMAAPSLLAKEVSQDNVTIKVQEMSKEEKVMAINGDVGQAEELLKKKKKDMK